MTDLQVATTTSTEHGVANANRSSRRKSGGQKDWTIKGLPAETVDVAREAAMSSGMKINAWIGKIINDSANFPLDSIKIGEKYENGIDHNASEIEKLRSQNDDLVRAITRLSAILAKSHDIFD